MKLLKWTAFIALLVVFPLGSVSCVVLARHDNGKHKGWYKNSYNHPGKKSMGHVRFGDNAKLLKVAPAFGVPNYYLSEININQK